MELRLACRSLHDASNIESLACCTDTNDARLDVRVESKFDLEGLVVEECDRLEESTGGRAERGVVKLESNSAGLSIDQHHQAEPLSEFAR